MVETFADSNDDTALPGGMQFSKFHGIYLLICLPQVRAYCFNKLIATIQFCFNVNLYLFMYFGSLQSYQTKTGIVAYNPL